MSKKERVHREQPPSQAIVRLKLFPIKDSLEKRADFFSLHLVKSNGDDPILAPPGTVSPGLVEALESNPPYIAIGDAVFARVDGLKAVKYLKDGKGRDYLERTYRLDLRYTAHHRQQLDKAS